MLIIDMPMQTDLVDRAVLYERLKEWQNSSHDTVTLAFLHEVKMLLFSAPRIKAVEMVRCGECVHYETAGCADGYGWCNDAVVSQGTWDDFYCADGERKEGAE